MIFLTKLDKSRVLVTIESIKFIESTPDTLVRFLNGDMLIVRERMDEVALLVEQFKARCIRGMGYQAMGQAGAETPAFESDAATN